MASVEETLRTQFSAFPIAYASRTDLLVEILVLGISSWQWRDGQAVYCEEDPMRALEDDFAWENHLSDLANEYMLAGYSTEAVNAEIDRDNALREQLLADTDTILTTVDDKCSIPAFDLPSSAQALVLSIPADITADWARAIEEIKPLLQRKGWIV